MEFLDCALIGVCAVNRSNTVLSFLYPTHMIVVVITYYMIVVEYFVSIVCFHAII